MNKTKAERLLREKRETARDAVKRAATPTTAEAFAEVRRALAWMSVQHPKKWTMAASILDDLERRTGAMALAWHEWKRADRGSEEEDRAEEMMEAALTNAPPVFTLEEVVEVLTDAGLGATTISLLARDLSALRSTKGGR